MPLSADQLAELRELVTPAGQKAFDALPDDLKPNLEVRYRMVGGDLRLVAAAMLRVLCQQQQVKAAEVSTGNLKRFKVDGEYEEEYFAPTSAERVTADNWCTLASALEAQAAGSGVPGPAFTTWGDLGLGAEGEVTRDW